MERTIVIGFDPNSTSNLKKSTSQCEFCDKKFQSVRAKNLHRYRVHIEPMKRTRKRKCRKCLTTFSSVKNFRNHTCQPEDNDMIFTERKEIFKVKIEKCQLIKRETELTNVSFNQVECLSCQKYFSSIEAFRSHSGCNLERYALEKLPNSINYPYKCQKCSASFATTSERFEHLATHLKCTDCQEKSVNFTSLSELRLHNKKYHAKWPCYACHLIFISLSNLKQHFSMIHPNLKSPENKSMKDLIVEAIEGNKLAGIELIEETILERYPFLATEADLIWRGKIRQILSHKSIQSHDIPEENQEKHKNYIICVLCNSVFNSQESLLEHGKKKCQTGRKHKGQLRLKARKAKRFRLLKSHRCDLCSLSFCWKVDLRYHSRTVHKIAFQCPNCQQEFTSHGFLQKHIDLCSNKVLALILGNDDEDD